MKKYKIIFWITTILIFLGEGVMSALTINAENAKQGFHMLGYPEYFRIMLTIGKIIGALLLIIPFVPARIKEWAYVAFGIDFLAAFISIWAVAGLHGSTFTPLIAFAVLLASYTSYHKLQGE